MQKMIFRFINLIAVFLCCLFMQPSFSQAGMITEQQEIAMGRQAAAALEQQYGIYQDEELNERVNAIGQRLAKVSGRANISYTFKVLNCSEINALACPGGFIYVYKGLVDYMPTDTELAGVLGHEVGHVAKRHTVHALEKQMLTNAVLIAATIGTGQNIMAVQNVLFAGYSRTDERGADKEGVNNTVKAGFNPYAMLITNHKLEDYAKQEQVPDYGLFNDHPEPEARIKSVEEQLKKLKLHPLVKVIDEENVLLQEGDWSFSIRHSIGNNKALYRGYLLAGSLWVAKERGLVNPNYFVVRDYGNTADIYYDDIQLIRLYPQDAIGYRSVGAYAAACVQQLQQWGLVVNSSK